MLFPEIDKGDRNWEMKQSAHFHIYCRPNSEVSKVIKYTCRDLDRDFEQIIELLEVGYENIITCYIYNSREEFQESEHTKFDAHALPEFETISTYYPLIQALRHEIVHVIVYWTMGPPNLHFLNEGIAEAIENCYSPGWWKKSPVHSRCKILLTENNLLSLKQLADNKYFIKIRDSKDLRSHFDLYEQCASLTSYLIGEYGINRFKSYFSKADQFNHRAIFRWIYGKEIEVFEEEWHEFLRNY